MSKGAHPRLALPPAKTLVQWNGFFYSFLLNLPNKGNERIFLKYPIHFHSFPFSQTKCQVFFFLIIGKVQETT
jgi:hypothetical protein